MNLTLRLRRAVPLWQIHSATVLTICVVAGGAWALGIRPIAARQAEASTRRETLRDLKQRATDVNAATLALSRQLAAGDAALASKAAALEPAGHINRRIALLTGLAHRVGLRIDEVQPGAAASYQHHRTVALRLAAAGSYPQCAAFLQALRGQCPDMGVRSIEVTADSPGQSAAAMVRMELTWFTAAE